jgi:hypothetical protein
MNVEDPGSRLIRWRIQLEEYDYEIVNKKGALNTNADALSRISMLAMGKSEDLNKKLGEDKKKRYCTSFMTPQLVVIGA